MRFLFASLLILSAAGLTAQQTSAKPPSSSHQATHQKPTDNAAPPTSPGAGNGADKTGTDKHDQIGITAVPEINIRRDRFDCLYLLLNALLVLIGGLTFVAIWYQAKKTADATIAMKQQVGEMGRQREVMFLQLRTMGEQVAEMSAQTDVLERSVSSAEKNLALIISKERPRIAVEEPQYLTIPSSGPARVEFKLIFSGSTVAYILESAAVAAISYTKQDLPTDFGFQPRISGLPSQILPPVTQSYGASAYFMPSMFLSPDVVKDLVEGKRFAHLWGFIRFRDAFYDVSHTERIVRFHYFWRYTDMRNLGSAPTDPPFGLWDGDYQEEESKKPN